MALRGADATFSAKPGGGTTTIAAEIEAHDVAIDGNKAGRVAMHLSARQPNSASALFDTLERIAVSATADKAEAADPALRPIIGDRVSLDLSGDKESGKLIVADARLSAGGGSMTARGVLDAEGYVGDVALSLPDAAPFSQAAGRDLTERLDLTVKGRAGFDGAVDLVLSGGGEAISAGADPLGHLLAGRSKLDGRIGRTEKGILRFEKLGLRTEALALDLNGTLGPDANDLTLTGRIADLGKVLPDSSGALGLDAAIDGKTLTANLSAPDAVIRGKPLREVTLAYSGTGGLEAQEGRITAAGRVGDAPLSGSGQIAFGGAEGLLIHGLTAAIGENRMDVDAALPSGGEARGTARLRIVDAAGLAPLFGIAMQGGITVEAQLSGAADAPTIALKADAANLRVDDVHIQDFAAAFDIADALTQPIISGSTRIKSISSGGTRVADLSLTANPDAGRSAFVAKASLDDGWQLAGEALVALTGWRPDAVLSKLSLRNGQSALVQKGTAELAATEGFRLKGLVLAAGGGEVTADIATSGGLSGKVGIRQFPLRFAAPFIRDLDPRGTIDADIDLSGTLSAPNIGYKLSGRQLAIAGPLPPAFPLIDMSASGTFAGDRLDARAAISGPGGLDLKASGAVRDLSSSATLDFKITGSVPLALADAFLSTRGTRLTGRAAVNLAISGGAAKPVLGGRITAAGATIKDPPTDIDLKDANLTAALSGGTLKIETLSARSAQSAKVTASGTIGVLQADTLPVDLQIKTEALRFNDQHVVAGEIGSDVSLKGALNGQSKLAGTVDIARLDIQIPQSMPASVEALELKHVNAPDYVAAAQPSAELDRASRLPATIALSLAIRSANRIFVTGRGLDAQLGGELQLLGSADAPRAIGEFTLERGRLAVLGRTLEFTSGSVNFNGDLDPLLNFLAATDVNGTKIEVRVTGQASDPKFGFTSNPELPQDEVLALLLFNKSLGELSPLQIAQLASEVSELGGLSGGPGILSRLKSSVGIDTLNLTTDDSGQTAVSAGSYVNEKVFVGVEQGSSSNSSRVKIDLDITKNLKLRGEAGADGKSKLGVGVEWEY